MREEKGRREERKGSVNRRRIEEDGRKRRGRKENREQRGRDERGVPGEKWRELGRYGKRAGEKGSRRGRTEEREGERIPSVGDFRRSSAS